MIEDVPLKIKRAIIKTQSAQIDAQAETIATLTEENRQWRIAAEENLKRQQRDVDTSATQAGRIVEQSELIESLDAIIEEEMGEWYSVEYAQLPIRLADIAHMRNAIAKFQKATK